MPLLLQLQVLPPPLARCLIMVGLDFVLGKTLGRDLAPLLLEEIPELLRADAPVDTDGFLGLQQMILPAAAG
eukprot:270701-Pyramimonas_sp.AAC.1